MEGDAGRDSEVGAMINQNELFGGAAGGGKTFMFKNRLATQLIIAAKIPRYYINVLDGHIVALGGGLSLPELERQVNHEAGWRCVPNAIWKNVREALYGHPDHKTPSVTYGVETFYPVFVKKDPVCAFMKDERANLGEDERRALES